MRLSRRMLWILLLLAVCVPVLLLLRDSVPEEAGTDVERGVVAGDALDPLRELGGPTDDLVAPTLAGRPAPVAESPGRGRVCVTVLAPGDLPLGGVTVRARGPLGAEMLVEGKAVTDAEGRAHFEDLPLDGSQEVLCLRRNGGKAEWGDARAVVHSQAVTLRVRFGMPLEVRCVDAESGLPHDRAAGAPIAPGGLVPALPGVEPWAAIEVSAPAGWIAWAERRRQFAVSTWARRLLWVYPLRRESRVRVIVRDHEGLPEATAGIEACKVAGRTLPHPVVEAGGPGVFVLRGVPFFRDETIAVDASAEYLHAAHWGTARLPTHPADEVDLVIDLPPEDKLVPARSTGHTGHESRFGTRLHWRGAPPGSLRVRVRRRDGTPASHALIRHGGATYRLDERGEILLEQVPAGARKIEVKTIGVLPCSGTAEVEADRETLLEIHEPEGGRIDVRVVDADGRPLPFAEVTVETPSKAPWVDEADGLQRIDPYVDHLGYRRLGHVEVGTVKLGGTWASRKGEVEVDVRAGETTHATVVLRTE